MTMTRLWDLGVVLVGLVSAIAVSIFLGILDQGRPATQRAAWETLNKPASQ